MPERAVLRLPVTQMGHPEPEVEPHDPLEPEVLFHAWKNAMRLFEMIDRSALVAEPLFLLG